jgi:Fe-S-cluster-containing dehydrogenase component
MKKCTLCVDRIYDELLPVADRQPACVLACPTSARMFGDFENPQSEVAKAAAARGMPPMLDDLGYKPVNQYLAPRQTPEIAVDVREYPKKSLTQLLREWAGGSKAA